MSSNTISKYHAAIELLGNRPVEINELAVDASGWLTARDGFLRFHFIYHGLIFALAAGKAGRSTRLSICAHLGHLPFSIESADGRRNVQAILLATSRGLPRGRIEISPRREIFLEGVLDIDAPLTPVIILAAVADFIARNRRHIELMMEFSPSMPAPILAEHWLARVTPNTTS